MGVDVPSAVEATVWIDAALISDEEDSGISTP